MSRVFIVPGSSEGVDTNTRKRIPTKTMTRSTKPYNQPLHTYLVASKYADTTCTIVHVAKRIMYTSAVRRADANLRRFYASFDHGDDFRMSKRFRVIKSLDPDWTQLRVSVQSFVWASQWKSKESIWSPYLDINMGLGRD